MGSLQPPPLTLLKLVGMNVGQWFQDTWNKLKNLQTQSNAALYVSGLTPKNGSPDGSDITWSACTVWYNGTAYPISAGNTTGGALLVWWNVGDTTFSSGNSFTPGPTVFGILTNNLGTADIVWNKPGAGSLQASVMNIQPSLYNGPNGVMFTDVVFISTPGTGVSWAAGNVYYKGVRYS